MERNDELQKKARRPGDVAIKGTVRPDVTGDPVAEVHQVKRDRTPEPPAPRREEND